MDQRTPPDSTASTCQHRGIDEKLKETKITELRRHIILSERLLNKEYQKLGILTCSLLRHQETVQRQDAAMMDAPRQIDTQRRVVDQAHLALSVQLSLSCAIPEHSACASCDHILAESDLSAVYNPLLLCPWHHLALGTIRRLLRGADLPRHLSLAV